MLRPERERERERLCRPNAATPCDMASQTRRELSLNAPTPILEDIGADRKRPPWTECVNASGFVTYVSNRAS